VRRFFNVFIMILNLTLMVGKLYLFNYLGWITLHPAAPIHTLQDSLLTAVAIALVFILISYVVWFVYCIFFLAILALGCLLYPFVILGTGYVTLHMIAAIAPAFLGVTDNFWTGCLAGCILMWIPNLSDDKASPVDSSTDEIGQHTKPV
jgi:hypothetical protein